MTQSNARKRSLRNSTITQSLPYTNLKHRKTHSIQVKIPKFIPITTTPSVRCRLRLPVSLTLQCYCVETDRRHSELLVIKELPETVKDLKQLISEKLYIPIICQLRLSVKEMVLFDRQSLSLDVSLREGDQLKLEYFGRSELDRYKSLVDISGEIERFYNLHVNPPKTKSTDACIPNPPIQQLENDILHLIQALDDLNHTVLLPWRNEATTCHRIYLTDRKLIDKVIKIWQLADVLGCEELLVSSMLVLWDYGENLEERVILMNKNVHVIAHDQFTAFGATDLVKYGSVGLLAGFGEFPAGQEFLGTNLKFLTKLVDYFTKTTDRFAMSIVSTLLFTLASHPNVPFVMKKAGIVEKLSNKLEGLDFFSNSDSEIAYGLILFYMALLRNPKFDLPNGYSPGYFKIKFQQQKNCTFDLDIAEREKTRGTSWGSTLPFIDVLFIPHSAPLWILRDNRGLIDSYLDMALTILSATFLDEKNIKLCVREDLFGYLVILSWKYKHRSILKNILSRFDPLMNKIPSLSQIARSVYAIRHNGLGASLELNT